MTIRLTGTRRCRALLACIRYDEIVVLQGAPVLGAVFAIGALDADRVWNLVLLVLANAALVAHVFLLNDWAGIEHDSRDPARASRVFLQRGVSRREIGVLVLLTLVLSMAGLAWLGRTPLLLGLLLLMASALYSLPQVSVKGVPLANSLLHFVTGVLHFLMGYAVFREIDAGGAVIGLFFAVVFSAGHLTQEVRDAEADARNGIRTNAVCFGRRACFLVAFGLFTLANALLVALALQGRVPDALVAVVALAYPVHAFWTWQALREGLPHVSVRRLQVRYRVLYAGIGLAMVTSLLLV